MLNKKMGKVRSSNLELLRIIAMFAIFMLHSGIRSHDLSVANDILRQFSLVGVNVFILISGYFGIRLTLIRVLNLLFIVLFWQSILYVVGSHDKSFVEFVVWPCHGWFVGTYFELMLLAPFLNRFVEFSSEALFTKTLVLYVGIELVFTQIFPVWTAFKDGYGCFTWLGFIC